MTSAARPMLQPHPRREGAALDDNDVQQDVLQSNTRWYHCDGRMLHFDSTSWDLSTGWNAYVG
jgi:hypothetical protein